MAQSLFPLMRKMSNGEAKPVSTATKEAKIHTWGQEGLDMKYKKYDVFYCAHYLALLLRGSGLSGLIHVFQDIGLDIISHGMKKYS